MNNDVSIAEAYQETLDYLYSFINLEFKRIDRYTANKLDPTRPQRLLAWLGAPQERFPAIHIAGTKGKGSVAAMCASCLRAAGLKVGLYTSPHLIEFRERIRILTPADGDGRIPQTDFITLMGEMKEAINAIPGVTWFEILTALAFLHFARREVDVAVVEVGLGGRLDPTNAITPLVSVITSLSLDHTEFLGDTLTQIAWEKGGIIKPGIPVVTASQPPEALNRLLEIAVERESPISIVGKNWVYDGEVGRARSDERRANDGQILTILQSPDSSFIPSAGSGQAPHPSSFRLALSGDHQLENATVALAALHVAQPHIPGLDYAAVQAGLANVQWAGRLQTIHKETGAPTILVDCAHNADSAAKLCHALTNNYDYENLRLIYGATIDKDISGMMAQLLPLAKTTIVTISGHPRATDPADLARIASDLGYEVMISANIESAVTTAWRLAGPQDLICVTGSIFVVGDLLNQWESLQSDVIRNT